MTTDRIKREQGRTAAIENAAAHDKRRPLKALQPRKLATLEPKVKPPPLTKRLSGRPGQRLREAIRKRDGYLCQACKREGVTRAGYQVDHIQELEDHGTNATENQEFLCKAHHDAKTIEANKRRKSAALPTAR